MEPKFIPLAGYHEYPPEEMSARARTFANDMGRRRTVRDFSDRPVPRALIEECLRAAGSAPSGANQQPWHFVAVSDSVLKQRIRVAAEAEDREFYEHRAPPEWLAASASTITRTNRWGSRPASCSRPSTLPASSR
jgi:hypothetical protein